VAQHLNHANYLSTLRYIFIYISQTRTSLITGTILTNINKEDLSDPTKKADQERRVPLGRLGQPEDLAGPCIFFASDLARYVNGASLLVDGGMAISLQ
jgi:L-rhamnose 1-dehydrogenase